MKMMAVVLLLAGFFFADAVKAGDVVAISPGGNRAGDAARASGEIWKGKDGGTVVATSAEVAGWVSKLAPGQTVRATASGSGWRLRGPDGLHGEIIKQETGYFARYGGRTYRITRQGGGNLWRVAKLP